MSDKQVNFELSEFGKSRRGFLEGVVKGMGSVALVPVVTVPFDEWPQVTESLASKEKLLLPDPLFGIYGTPFDFSKPFELTLPEELKTMSGIKDALIHIPVTDPHVEAGVKFEDMKFGQYWEDPYRSRTTRSNLRLSTMPQDFRANVTEMHAGYATKTKTRMPLDVLSKVPDVSKVVGLPFIYSQQTSNGLLVLEMMSVCAADPKMGRVGYGGIYDGDKKLGAPLRLGYSLETMFNIQDVKTREVVGKSVNFLMCCNDSNPTDKKVVFDRSRVVGLQLVNQRVEKV